MWVVSGVSLIWLFVQFDWFFLAVGLCYYYQWACATLSVKSDELAVAAATKHCRCHLYHCSTTVADISCGVMCWSGNHLRQVGAAMHGFVPAACWAELPSYCHPQGHDPGWTVCTIITSIIYIHFLRATAAIVLAIAILSVCPSVTRVDQSKMMHARITKSSPLAAWKTPVSGSVELFYKFHSSDLCGIYVTQSEGAKWEAGGEICNFQPLSRCISETVRDRA